MADQDGLMDAQAFIMGIGVPSAKFPELKTGVKGRVKAGANGEAAEVQQQRDFDTGEPLYWNDGKPRLQAKVVLATDERSDDIDDDDGSRALYLKSNLQRAVAKAIRAAGASRLEVDGWLEVVFTAEGTPPRKGANPPKLFEAVYQPPDPVEQAAGPGGSEEPPVNNNTPTAPQDSSAPAGVDPAAWAKLPDDQKQAARKALAQTQPDY